MENILIRPAVLSDMAAMHSLVYELAVYEKAPDQVLTTVEEYERDFQDGCFEGLIAELDGEVVGMMLYFMMYSTWKGKMLYLDDFVVRESHRRFGVGQKLYDRYLQIAKESGCRLTKWQVLDWNDPAIRFYEKNGAYVEKGWWNVKVEFENR